MRVRREERLDDFLLHPGSDGADMLDGRAGNLHSLLGEHSVLVHLHSGIEGGLATECQEITVSSLRFDDLLHIFRSDGKKVDFVGEPFAGKDSINVGADKYSGDVLLLERFEGASPGVVKFSGLAYRQTRQNQEPKFGHRIV